MLIASHADKAGCPKNARGEYVSPVASSILAKIQQKFRNDLDIVERVFVLDTPVAMTPDIKALKHQLYQLRANILRVSIKIMNLFTRYYLNWSVCTNMMLLKV